MHVKGIAWLAREPLMSEQFGAETWREFMRTWRAAHPGFPVNILPVSKLDSTEFLALHDEMVRRFFGGDPMTYWRFGVDSGEYALTRGQLKGLFQPGELRKLLHFTPSIYRSYFDGGECVAKDTADGMEVRISGVPPHVYFEYSVVGFARGALSVLGAKNPMPDRLRGFSAGDADVLYRFRV